MRPYKLGCKPDGCKPSCGAPSCKLNLYASLIQVLGLNAPFKPCYSRAPEEVHPRGTRRWGPQPCLQVGTQMTLIELRGLHPACQEISVLQLGLARTALHATKHGDQGYKQQPAAFTPCTLHISRHSVLLQTAYHQGTATRCAPAIRPAACGQAKRRCFVTPPPLSIIIMLSALLMAACCAPPGHLEAGCNCNAAVVPFRQHHPCVTCASAPRTAHAG